MLMQGREGRKGSLIAEQYARGERILKEGVPQADEHPTNEEVAKAVQQKVAVSAWVLHGPGMHATVHGHLGDGGPGLKGCMGGFAWALAVRHGCT